MDLVEDVAEGRIPELLPHVQEKMNQIDPLFERDHGVEKALSMLCLLMVICLSLCCCRISIWCCCCGCCRRGVPQEVAGRKKDQ